MDWHFGWMNHLVLMFLLLFYLTTVYFQVLSSRPSAFDTDSAFMARMDLLEDARVQVSNSYKAYDFMRAMVDEFARVDSPPTAKCLDLLSILCPLNMKKFKELYGTDDAKFTQDILDTCRDISRYSGYVDNSNRMVGTIYVYQTRRNTKPCTAKMREIDPYLGNVRQCLTDVYDTEYLPRVPKSCTTCNAFDYQNGKFVFALTGDAFNLPETFMKCRIDGLEVDEWLDFRTTDLCFLVTMLDTANDGRIVAYEECFRFGDGGKVTNVREVASVSFLANGDTALVALTICSIIIITARQLWVLYWLWRKPQYNLAVWFRFAGPALELTANALFLQYIHTVSNFAFEVKMTKSTFYNETFAFLKEFDYTFAVAQHWTMFTLIASLGLFFRLADVILSVEFHPSSALVSGILRQAGSRLFSFFFVSGMFVLVYSFIGMLLFSRTSTQFADFGRALNTLMMLFLGEGQDLQAAIFQPSNPKTIGTIQIVYFWVYVGIATLLLMSVLLAIIVGAFVELSDHTKSGEPMLSFSITLFEAVRFTCKTAWIHLLCCCCWRSKKKTTTQQSEEEEEDVTERQEQLEPMRTPLEQLIQAKERFRFTGCSAAELRPILCKVYCFDQTVERILQRCRTQTQMENLRHKEIFLRGLDPSSPALTGLSLGILESIETRLKQQLRTQHHNLNQQQQK